MDGKGVTLEEQARLTERSIAAKSSANAALEATIRSAKLYLQALRLADTPADRKRIDAKCKHLLAQAERLKDSHGDSPPIGVSRKQDLKPPSSRRKLTTRENIILLEGSKVHGLLFKPWTKPPSAEEFILQDGESLFVDPVRLSLSSTQLDSFAGWKRPHEALAALSGSNDGQSLPTRAVMHIPVDMDLVQDMTSDCSVVASLCAGTARFERGHSKILRTIIYPYDYDNDKVALSPNGRYILRLYFNGCWRRVEIDDFLPASKTSRVLHVIDRRHPTLLWPALVEKAYLKVRGGYDFPGSNSGTDLAVLTGWIPQQVFLHDEDVEPDHLWDEIFPHFEQGNVLLTIGTGKLSRREQRQLGLAAEHDYAVLRLAESAGTKEILIKNPWADGDVWRGATRRRPNHDDQTSSPPEAVDEAMMPGTFWMDFGSVFQYFENMYINWNSGLFSHREDAHFTLKAEEVGTNGNIFVNHPQFVIEASDSGDIWILLNRHFRTGDYTQASMGRNGYISLYLYEQDGNKVISSEGAKRRGPFVDSPNTLLRITGRANTRYTAVVVTQALPPGKLNFTLSAFANMPVSVREAQLQYPQKQSIASGWTRSNAGGNSDSPNYLTNPQFRLSLSRGQKIALVLRVPETEQQKPSHASSIHVKILIVFSPGSRITRLRPRDVQAHSGDYRRGNAIVETGLKPGHYTIICSTFDQNQHTPFDLELYSFEAGLPLALLPAEGAGRVSIRSNRGLFRHDVDRILAPLTIPRLSRVTFVARYAGPGSSQSSLFKMTLEQGQGPYKQVLASSEFDDEEFSSVASGLRIGDMDLDPSMGGPGTGGLWLVLERLAQGQGPETTARDEVLVVEMFTEERIDLGAWGSGGG